MGVSPMIVVRPNDVVRYNRFASAACHEFYFPFQSTIMGETPMLR
jgi:hypothetical protein